MQLCENANQKRDADTNELVDSQKHVDDQALILIMKQVEYHGLVLYASDDIQDDAVPL